MAGPGHRPAAGTPRGTPGRRRRPGRPGPGRPPGGQLGQGGVRAGHLGGADGDQRARLAGGGRVQEAGAQRLPPEGHHLLPVPEQRVGASQPVGDQRGQRLAARVRSRLRQRLAEPPFRLGKLAGGERHRRPARSCAAGTAPTPSTASRRAAPRDSSASIRCSAAVSSRRSRSARAGEMSEAHCRWVAASASRPPAASSPASRSSWAARSSSGRSRAATRCCHDAVSLTTEAARACSRRRRVGRDAGVDGVPDQQVADRHRADSALPATSRPGRKRPQARSPRWASRPAPPGPAVPAASAS